MTIMICSDMRYQVRNITDMTTADSQEISEMIKYVAEFVAQTGQLPNLRSRNVVPEVQVSNSRLPGN